MTVGTQVPRVEYTEDGVATLFAVPYAFFDDTDLVVTRFTGTGTHDSDAHTLILGHDYSVAGGYTPEGGPAVGSITLLTGGVAAAELRIDRFTKRSQEIHYVPGDDFPARSHENGLDREEMQIQELDRDNLSLEDIIDELGEHVLKAGPGITIVYDDDANTITISATSIEQALADLPDCVMLSGDQQTFTGEDGEGNTGGLTAEDVQDIVAAMLVDGTGISHSYNDATGKITITNTLPEDGGGGGGGALGPLLTDIQNGGIGDNEFLVGVGPNDVARKALTDFALTLLDDPNAAAMLATLGALGISASSLGSPGYIKFANNLKIQWGSVSCAGDTNTVVNYPSAFSTFGVPVGSGGSTSTSESDNARVISATASSFTVCNNKESAVPFFWIAIGV
jgi:hypothetical protein